MGRRRWIRVFAAVVLVLGALLVSLHTAPVRVRVLKWLLVRLERTGVVARADSLDYNLATFDINVRGVALAAADTPAEPFLTADVVRTRLGWRAFLGRFDFTIIDVEHPQITLVRRIGLNDSSTDLTASTRAPSIYLGDVRVRNLGLLWRDQESGATVTLSDISLDLRRAGGTSSGTITMNDAGSIRWQRRTTSIGRIDGRLSWNGQDLSLDQVHVAVPEFAFEAHGRITELLGAARAALDVSGDMNLSAVDQWFPSPYGLAGPVRLNGKVSGTLPLVAASITLEADDVAFGHVKPIAVNGAVDITPNRFSVNTFTAELADGKVSGHGTTTLDPMQGMCRVEWSGVNVPALASQIIKPTPAALPDARASGSFEARWDSAHLDDLSVRGRMETTSDRTNGTQQGKKGRLPLEGTTTLTLEKQHATVIVDQLLAGARIRGDLSGTIHAESWTDSTIGGHVSATVADMGQVARMLAHAGIANLPDGTAGSLDVELAAAGTIGVPVFSGPLTFSAVRVGEMRDLSGGASLTVKRAGIQLDDIEAGTNGNTARGDVRLSFDSHRVKGRFAASVSDIGALAPALANIVPPGPALQIEGAVAGSVDRPELTATTTGANLLVAGQVIDRLRVDIAAVGVDVAVRRFEIDSGEGHLEGNGRVDLEARTYQVNATATRLPVRPVPAAVGIGELPLTATATGQVNGEGSFDALSGRARVSLMDVNWRGIEVGSIDVDANASGHTISLQARASDLDAAITGDVDITPVGPVRLHGEWTINDAAAMGRRLRWSSADSVAGSAAFGFDLAGTRDRLRESRIDVDLRQVDLVANGRTVRLAHPSRMTYDGRVLQARDVVFTANRSTLRVDGSVGDSNATALTAVLRGSLDDFAFAGSIRSGSIDLELKAKGPIQQPEIEGSFRVADARVQLTDTAALIGAGLSGRYDRGLIRLDEVRATFGGATLNGSAQVPAAFFSEQLRADWRRFIPTTTEPAQLSVNVQNITSQALEPFVAPGALTDVQGHLDAAIELQADRAAIERLTGSVTLTRAELSAAGVSLDQERPTRLRLHDGRVDVDEWQWGRDDHRITVTGGATLDRDPILGVDVSSALDLRVLDAFIRPATARGRIDSRIHVGSTLSAPSLNGFATFTNGELHLASPRLVITDLTGTVTLSRDAVTFERLWASLNGGDTEIGGSLRQRGWRTFDGEVTVQTRGAALDLYGLRAEADARLAWRLDSASSTVSGEVTLLRSSYREPLSVTGGLLRALQASSRADMPGSQSGLDRVGLDVHIVTADDMQVRNNYAQVSVSADLRLVGRISQPGMLGRAVLADGGLVFFGGNRYRLADQGSIDFVNATRIEPALDVKAVTRVRNTEITLALKGTPTMLQTSLTSDDPALSQADLVSLLVSGRTTSEAGSGGFIPGSTELLGYLSGELFDVAGRAVGLDTVRIERGTPNLTFDAGLVATETDPGTRLTFGKTIRGNVQVVFSQSLRQSGGLTWIVSYAPRSNVELKAVSLDNGDRLYAFQHQLVFGGRPALAPRPTRSEPPRVKDVQIVGADADEATLRSRLKLHAGERFDVFTWQDDRDRLEAFYHDGGWYEARIIARRIIEQGDQPDAGTVTLVYTVNRGPRTTIVVQGIDLPGSSRVALRRTWGSSIGDAFLVEESLTIVRTELVDRGLLFPTLGAKVERPTADEKRLLITVEPGVRSRVRRIVFVGNHAVARKKLEGTITDAGLERAVWLDPDRVRQMLEAFYHQEGYLNASIQLRPLEFEAGIATRTIDIHEGALFRIREIHIDGVDERRKTTIERESGLSTAMPFSEAAIERARAAIDRAYRAQGFNDVAVTLRTEKVPGPDLVDVFVSVEEGGQQRLRDIMIAGLERTKPGLVSRALKLQVGQPVNLAEWNRARQRLYETGAFRRVDIEEEQISGSASGASGADSEEPIRAKVTVEEWPPLRVRYGLELNDQPAASSVEERLFAPAPATETGRTFGAGLAGDIGLRNLVGRALSAGLAGRYTRDFRAARAYTTSPLLFGLPITSNVFVSRSREELGTSDVRRSRFVTDKTGLTLEQRVRPFTNGEVAYGFTFERNHTFDLKANPGDITAFDITVNIGRLSTTLIVDSRDDLVDATRGTFHSSVLEYGPAALGSDIRFVKYLLHERYYRTLGAVVFATSARFGVANAFDQLLIPSERFFAGGGNSVRGYSEDALSPRDIFGDPIGGSALTILNQEVRFPIVKYLRGVGFLDAGRAFDTFRGIRLTDLAVGVGGGFRIQTPVALIRIDFGLPLDRSVAPRRARWFFSIGQAF